MSGLWNFFFCFGLFGEQLFPGYGMIKTALEADAGLKGFAAILTGKAGLKPGNLIFPCLYTLGFLFTNRTGKAQFAFVNQRAVQVMNIIRFKPQLLIKFFRVGIANKGLKRLLEIKSAQNGSGDTAVVYRMMKGLIANIDVKECRGVGKRNLVFGALSEQAQLILKIAL